MTAINTFSRRPRRDPPREDEVDAWVVPLGRVAGIEFQLSYWVFVACALLGVIVATVQGRGNNSDLPMIAVIGSAFWVTGWLVQVVVHCFSRFVGGVPIESLTIGLLGIESRTRSWSARSALLVASATLFAIVAVGGMFLLAESLILGSRSLENTFSVWQAPGFGLSSRESVWLAGAWLCLIQAICQMFPLPKSLGRLWIVASVSSLLRDSQETTQTDLVRRCLQVIALATAIVALASIATEPTLLIPRWPLLLLLAVMLWSSARGPDIFDMLIGFGSNVAHVDEEVESGVARRSGITRTRQSLRSVLRRRRARKALQRERSEAEDAARLDQVLCQLHEQGADSLSPGDRALLERVSQTLRESRMTKFPDQTDVSGNDP